MQGDITGQQMRRIAIAMDIEEPYPHHQDVFTGIQQYAREHPHWRCQIDQHPTLSLNKRSASTGQYDGVIARAWPALHQRLVKQGIPLVNVLYANHKPGMSGVYHDPAALGEMAANHLIKRGFKRIGYMYDPNTRYTAEMRDAFRACVQEQGRSYNEVTLVGEDVKNLPFYIRLENTLNHWIGSLRPPVALCIQSPFIARLAIQICHDKGLHVPQDVSILTDQDLKAVVEVSPQISAIDGNFEKVGYEAAAMLERMMDGQEPGEVMLIPPLGVRARESTDFYAVEDPLVANALRYISANLSSKLRAEDIAYALAVSVSSLQKRFASQLGRGVGEEVLRLRLSTVRVMLGEPEHTVAQIAEATGFADAAVLSRAFKRELGITPGAYRKQIAADHA